MFLFDLDPLYTFSLYLVSFCVSRRDTNTKRSSCRHRRAITQLDKFRRSMSRAGLSFDRTKLNDRKFNSVSTTQFRSRIFDDHARFTEIRVFISIFSHVLCLQNIHVIIEAFKKELKHFYLDKSFFY